MRHSESFEMNTRRDNGIVCAINKRLMFDLDSTGFDDALHFGERITNFDQKVSGSGHGVSFGVGFVAAMDTL
jgi:hypothetical protein